MPSIRTGVTIRSLIVYGEDTAVTYSVYDVTIATGTPTLLGSGTVGTLLDITDFSNGNQDSYLVLRFAATTTTQTLYGGRLFSDDAGLLIEDLPLLPRDFVVNDDG